MTTPPSRRPAIGDARPARKLTAPKAFSASLARSARSCSRQRRGPITIFGYAYVLQMRAN